MKRILTPERIEERRARKRERDRAYLEKNRDAVNEKHRLWYRENRAALIEKAKQYSLRNIEKVKERRARYFQENKAKINEKKKAYRAKIGAEAREVRRQQAEARRLEKEKRKEDRRKLLAFWEATKETREAIQRAKDNEKRRKYYISHRREFLASCSTRFRRHSEELSDLYIRHLIAKDSRTIKREDVPEELVKTYRAYLVLKRELNNLTRRKNHGKAEGAFTREHQGSSLGRGRAIEERQHIAS